MDIRPQSRLPKFRKDRKTHIERALSVIPFPYYWAWAVFGGATFLISFALLMMMEKSFYFIWIFLVLSLLITWQSIGVVWAHKKMGQFAETFINLVIWPEEEIKRRYEKQMAKIFDDRKMVLTGILAVILAHILGIDYMGFSFHAFLTIIFKFIYYLSIYTLGIGLYVLIMTAMAVNKIGDLPLSASVLFSRDMQSIGILYSKFTAYASSVYLIWVIFLMMTPLELSHHERVMIFLAFAVLLLSYFIIPQRSIHRLMARTKHEKIDAFSSHLCDVADVAFINPTDERLLSLNDMLNIQRQMDKMSEWPFSFYELIHIIVITIIPLIVLALEILHGALYEHR